MNEEEENFIQDTSVRPSREKTCAPCCVIFSLLITPIICIIVIYLTSKKDVSTLKYNDSLWFPSAGSESCIRLMDINGDGLDDIIVALTEVTVITTNLQNDANRSAFCQTINVESPCSGIVYGIRGYDFSILWSFRVKASIFEIVCDIIDVNNDGYRDCIGSGRQGTLVAFDPRLGKPFWDNSTIKTRHSLWNFYNPVILPVDVDQDNINDFLISHGGNPTIPSEIHERDAGCLLIISSRTGNQIGEPFWMPDKKETYMSPVLYGNSTILFGTGGETVSGGLYSISIDNIIKQNNQYLTIFKSFEKGVMVPPIVLDVDHDGIDDILVSCFDGTLELINGRTMKPIWTRIFPRFEFYATPAPGDFNSDSFVDFMLILNYGEWDRYDYSETLVIDGLTGETLWKKTSTFSEFTSPLTLQMTKHGEYQDSFIYRQRGETAEKFYSNTTTSSILFHGIGLQDGEIHKNENLISSTTNYSCDQFRLNDSIVNIYLTNIKETRLIAVIYPPMNNENNLCSNFEPMERSGGSIGDLNGDGILDTVDITTFISKLTSHNLDNFIAHSLLTRFSLNINKVEHQIIANYEKDIFKKTIDQNLIDLLIRTISFPTQPINNNKDLQMIAKQTWNSYLGRFSDSHYYRKI
ncbi:unnamed protein product [Rotaria magnacalcarata]|uniref:FAM234A/B beta-propeller domain-containing protein n=1 Tax=Rotaria magnacalcarata TaxID=392030 RepID=A0A816UM36_9BILA|nr:unnamed protein product [Rotaria magnacalcarata]